MARVLVISPNPGGSGGGVERFCDLLTSVLDERGHDVRVAGPSRRTGRWSMRLGIKALAESASVPTSLPGWQPHVLVTNGLVGGLTRPRGMPVIHVFHGTMVGHARSTGRGEVLRQRVRSGVGGGLAELLASIGAVNVAVSESAAREAHTYYRARIERVIPNGVDTTSFHPLARSDGRRAFQLDESGRFALFVGNAEARKGWDVALEACRQAGFELLAAGPKPIAGAHNLGLVAPDRLPQLYGAADCVVLPTRYEACSYVVLEALACGVPLVTTEVGWIPTLLAHVPRYRALIAAPRPEAFAAVLGRLQDATIATAVTEARDYVLAHSSIASFADEWGDLVADVARGPRREGHVHGQATVGVG
jgi:glycosyltransferase involved in cell wall biosynthesis